jgi:hypothetical protein
MDKEKLITSNEELNIIEEFIEKDFKKIDKISKEFPSIISNDYCLKVKRGMENLKEKVQEEKTHRQNSPNDRPNDRKKDESPLPSNDSEINKKITSLQSQINDLEQKQSQNPNSNDSKQTKKELTRLKSELATLKAKQNEQNEKNPKSNGFPWMAIGGGITIIILLIIIVFLYKKSKK